MQQFQYFCMFFN